MRGSFQRGFDNSCVNRLDFAEFRDLVKSRSFSMAKLIVIFTKFEDFLRGVLEGKGQAVYQSNESLKEVLKKARK